MTQLHWQRAPDGDGEPGAVHLEVAVGPDGRIHLRESDAPQAVVVTTPAKWEAFVKGVKAGEFDDFTEE
ncbi:DUF397 domain-containing protein [Streptomyces sp. NA02950]|uniref:DUF397 domain-containing protein n=1 Tax=Streptomyces sp. NA02950 TaxID=2742137 RepID=UPI001590D05C|nr:DUF397 domain-containing protein [Streptomyces sp. NA02950]QKV93504.1 DUF397 domain-containing protein [Streptomyces sp. NA02950]